MLHWWLARSSFLVVIVMVSEKLSWICNRSIQTNLNKHICFTVIPVKWSIIQCFGSSAPCHEILIWICLEEQTEGICALCVLLSLVKIRLKKKKHESMAGNNINFLLFAKLAAYPSNLYLLVHFIYQVQFFSREKYGGTVCHISFLPLHALTLGSTITLQIK